MNPEDRYARHHLIDWWDQDRLKAGRVMVVGAGALGNEVIKLLALLGVGHILIVDYDTIELSNLTRTVLFREADIGRSKATVAAERARAIQPELDARTIEGDLEFDVGLGVYRSMDVVIGCLDSLEARLALNRNCRRAGVPWINGGIEATVAEVALYSGRGGACFECAMTPPMWERCSLHYSCSGLKADAAEDKMPTTAVVASLAAGYMVNEALTLLHRTGEDKAGLEFGQKIYLTLKPYSFGVYTLPIDPACLAHDVWDPVEALPTAARDLTVKGLLDACGLPEGSVELGFDLLTELRCVRCGRTETILRPVEKSARSLITCAECGTETREPILLNRLDSTSPLADLPLDQIGVPDYQIVAVKSASGRRFVQLGAYPLAASAPVPDY